MLLRIISDNGPQVIANDFKKFVRVIGMKHVRTSPYYPQSNGKKERWHHSLKSECIRPGELLSLENARAVVGTYIDYCKCVRLNSAIGFIAPLAKLEGRNTQIFKDRDRIPETAREVRRKKRKQPRIFAGDRGSDLFANVN